MDSLLADLCQLEEDTKTQLANATNALESEKPNAQPPLRYVLEVCRYIKLIGSNSSYEVDVTTIDTAPPVKVGKVCPVMTLSSSWSRYRQPRTSSWTPPEVYPPQRMQRSPYVCS